MKIGLVMEYVLTPDGYEFSEEIQEFVEWLSHKKEDFFAIHPANQDAKSENFKVLNIKSKNEELLPIDDLSSVYFGGSSQKMYKLQISNSLTENLSNIANLIDILKQKPNIYCVNSLDAIVYNFSKDYIFKLAKLGLPVVNTVEITSFDQLKSNVSSNSRIISKPKISERAVGAVPLRYFHNQKNGELNEYFNKYVAYAKLPINGTISTIMNCQGLIIQEFQDEFVNIGEKKFFMIDGDLTVARKNKPQNSRKSDVDLFSFKEGGYIVRYDPTPYEIDFAKDVYKSLSKIGKEFRYVRIDIIGDKQFGLKISEVELINPCSSTARKNSLYTKEEVNNHNSRIYDALVKN